MLSSRNVTHRRRLLCSPQRRRARQEACPCFQHARGTTQRRGINTTMKSRRHRGQASVYESPSISIVHRLRKTSMWRTAMREPARAGPTHHSCAPSVANQRINMKQLREHLRERARAAVWPCARLTSPLMPWREILVCN